MNIYFNSYASAFQCPGGGEIQLLKSKEALERRGHKVILFDQWKHSLRDADVVHQFSVQGGTYNLCAYAHHNGIPLAISPILWLSDSIDQYPINEIHYMTQLADVICTNSNAEITGFLKHFDASIEKYTVTHNGVDASFFDRVEPALFFSRYHIHRPFVLCVGNIERRKNQFRLLEAATRLGLHTVLIGNIRDQDYFQKINSCYGGNFSYLGYIEHSSAILKSAYSACSVFVLPSLLETPGLAALEAAVSGAPIVITKEGCTEEYFGEEAYYVDPNSADDIAEKIFAAVDSNIDRKSISKSRMQRFTWDNLALELESAYAYAIKMADLRRAQTCR